MSVQEHQQRAGHDPITYAIITVSDTRTPETDKNRHYLEERLSALGHHLAAYRLIPDEPDQVERTLNELADNNAIQLILVNGGTGIAPRDTTYDVISRLLDKTLPGFGEIFRMISFEDIGPAAILSRATAGVYRHTFIVSMPGSHNAVQTAMERLIIPEIHHLVWEVTRP